MQRITSMLAGAMLATLVATSAHADVVTDWNRKAGEIVAEAKLGTPPAVRVMAIVQTAVHDAIAAAGNSPSARAAAAAAANRATLKRLVPSQQRAIDAAGDAALAAIADGSEKVLGIAAGEHAAAAILAMRVDELAAVVDVRRPHTTAGAYVPTVAPAAVAWPQRTPWLMPTAAHVRPAPPPALTSDTWARDFDEVKTLGARNSAKRTAEQTEIARFWDYSLPPIYFGVAASVAQAPGRDVLRNAKLYAAVAQAMDDALIAVFDAKYHYNFWRPVTAIRNADLDGHPATERDPSWTALIDNPVHPEYPSAHAILAAAVGTVVAADMGDARGIVLSTSSPTANGSTRRWQRIDDFIGEVASARIYEGIHYRFSTEVGVAMGRRIGELAVARHLAQH